MLQKENRSEGVLKRGVVGEKSRGKPWAQGSGRGSLRENCGECLSTGSLFGANVSHISSLCPRMTP